MDSPCTISLQKEREDGGDPKYLRLRRTRSLSASRLICKLTKGQFSIYIIGMKGFVVGKPYLTSLFEGFGLSPVSSSLS